MPSSEITPRVVLKQVTPQVSGAMGALHSAAVSAAADAKVEADLLELIRIRASQINGCAFCIDMHTKNARAKGETEQRIYVLNAWRETPFFTERERAALALTEAILNMSTGGKTALIFTNHSFHFGGGDGGWGGTGAGGGDCCSGASTGVGGGFSNQPLSPRVLQRSVSSANALT